MEADLQNDKAERDALREKKVRRKKRKVGERTTSGMIASTAAYCPLEPLIKDMSAARTPRAYNALLSTMTNMMGHKTRILPFGRGLPTRKIRNAIAPAERIKQSGKKNTKASPPEQIMLADAVSEKYAVIQDVATWKMSVPGRATVMYQTATKPTTGDYSTVNAWLALLYD